MRQSRMVGAFAAGVVLAAIAQTVSADTITGRVIDGGGKPVAGAVVVVAGRAKSVSIVDGQVESGSDVPKALSDANGRFSLIKPNAPFILLAVADSGLARSVGGQTSGRTLTLERWARIQGTVRVGSRPDVGRRVMTLSDWGSDPAGPMFTWFSSANSSDRGEFDLPRVAPGTVILSRSVAVPGQVGTDIQFLDISPGSQLTTTVGGIGRPVVGRIAFPDEADKPSFSGGVATLGRIQGPNSLSWGIPHLACRA